MRVATLNRILGAGLCAAIATYLTVSLVGPGAAPPSPPPPHAVVMTTRELPPDTRPVVVAAAPLRFGQTIKADLLTEVQWPAASLPPGHFPSREALLGPGNSRTVLTAIGKNEPILASKITGIGQRGMLSAIIEDGKKAVTIRVDDVLGVAGFVQPDDRVDILLTRYDRPPVQTGKPAIENAFTDLLLQNVRVLAIDQIADRSPQAKPAKAVTVEVPTEDAQKLVLGASVGQLSLALRNAGSANVIDARRIGLDDLPSTHGDLDTPKPSQPGRGVIVSVTRGTSERSFYELTSDGRREIRKTQIGAAGAQGGPSPGPQSE